LLAVLSGALLIGLGGALLLVGVMSMGDGGPVAALGLLLGGLGVFVLVRAIVTRRTGPAR